MKIDSEIMRYVSNEECIVKVHFIDGEHINSPNDLPHELRGSTKIFPWSTERFCMKVTPAMSMYVGDDYTFEI